jgi:hypothetical protein
MLLVLLILKSEIATPARGGLAMTKTTIPYPHRRHLFQIYIILHALDFLFYTSYPFIGDEEYEKVLVSIS